MKEDEMIADIVKMLDSGVTKGVGHINIDVDQNADTAKEVQTMGCTDCSRTPLACSIPTLQEGLDDYK